MSYRPAIEIRYEVNGREIETWAYHLVRIYSADRNGQQAIIDSFQFGATYLCWYAPNRPDQAVLVLGHLWGACVALIIPIGLLIVGALGIVFAWKITSMQPVPVASDGRSFTSPTAQRPVPWMQIASSPRNTFDPAQLGDPIAMKTEWAPLKDGGANFHIHKLVEVDSDRLEFRTTVQAIMFGLALLLVGMVGFVADLASIVSGMASGTIISFLFVVLPLSLLFAAEGCYWLWSFEIPIVLTSGRDTSGRVEKCRRRSSIGALPRISRTSGKYMLCRSLLAAAVVVYPKS